MVESHLSYGTHGFDSESDHIAKTIFGFMIKSVFGPYKEIVSLIPRFRETGNQLFEHCFEVMRMVTQAGGSIISLVTDNNRVNENMFKRFNVDRGVSETYYPATRESFF